MAENFACGCADEIRHARKAEIVSNKCFIICVKVVRNDSILKADALDAKSDGAGGYASLHHVTHLLVEECLGDG